ncbi:unnamed protein product, partial [Brenthis ino]
MTFTKMRVLMCLLAILPVCHGAVRDTYRRSKTSYNTNSMLRYKRNAPCRYWQEEFRCNDGTCITAHRKCDGVIDCPDASDETYYLCRDVRCPDYYFRCTYGACVEKTALCNGISECADNSDELHVKCRNVTNIIGSQFKCDDGNLIELYLQCDGIFHCGDGSDETSITCSGVTCPANFFQCAYGACVDSQAQCNNTIECADGSDESNILCNRRDQKRISIKSSTITPIQRQNTNLCVLPPHPKNGMFIENGVSSIYRPGTIVKDFYLNVTCQPGYKVVGGNFIICLDGFSSPNRLPTCAQCGTLTPRAEPLVVGGKISERGEIPWHVGIYKKTISGKYQLICGGSLISRNIIVSAAHCFWLEGYGMLPEEEFAVAVGKLYREWNHPRDELYVQKSDVKKIILARRFHGIELNYQNDLAVIIVKDPFDYKPYIRPLCLDFTVPFYENQRRHGDLGIVAGFGLTKDHKGSESPILKVVDMPYVPFEECLDKTPIENAEYITNDKFCAGFGNGTSVCKGDSGGGWAYGIVIDGTLRYFLGGVVSTSPFSYDGSQCNIYALTSFTDVFYHSPLIRRYWMP